MTQGLHWRLQLCNSIWAPVHAGSLGHQALLCGAIARFAQSRLSVAITMRPFASNNLLAEQCCQHGSMRTGSSDLRLRIVHECKASHALLQGRCWLYASSANPRSCTRSYRNVSGYAIGVHINCEDGRHGVQDAVYGADVSHRLVGQREHRLQECLQTYMGQAVPGLALRCPAW